MDIEFDTSPTILPKDNEGRVLGLRRDLEDKTKLLSNQFMGRVMLGEVDYSKLPESMGIKKWLQIENQRNQGSCQGHAQSTACEVSVYHSTNGQLIQFSRQFCYLATQRIDGISGDNGSTMSGGAESASKYGLPLESEYPYLGGYPRGGWRAIPESVWTKAKKNHLLKYRVLKNYEEMIAWLAGKIGAIVWGVDWNAFCEPDSNGCVTRVRSGGGGGHALAVTDWNCRFKDARGRPFLGQPNSWGADWGEDGWAYIHPDVCDYHCRNNDVIGFAKVEGEDIRPNSFDWLKNSFFHLPVTAV